jgi:tripartite-type tricarboxylate transporter receptor subunit TctC
MFTFIRFALAVIAFQLACVVQAQTFPNHPIKLVVPYPPGATTDAVARLVSQKVREDLGQPVIVDNRGGASGNIGSDFVAKAAPDGYTLVLGTDATHASNPYLFKGFPFDPIKNATPITMAVKNIIVLVAHPSFPPNTIPELIDYAKKNPGKLAYASSGVGSPHHLAGELFNQLAGTDIVHVAYKGGGPAVTDVMGGQVTLAFSSLGSVSPHLNAGKLKVLAVTEKTRYEGLPKVPAISETIPNFEMSSWLGFFAPAGLPAPVLKQLHRSITKALLAPDVSSKLHASGLLVVANTPEQFAALQKADYEKRGQLIKLNQIQAE